MRYYVILAETIWYLNDPTGNGGFADFISKIAEGRLETGAPAAYSAAVGGYTKVATFVKWLKMDSVQFSVFSREGFRRMRRRGDRAQWGHRAYSIVGGQDHGGFNHRWTQMDTDKNPKFEIRSRKQISMARTLQTQILEPRNALRTRKLFDGKNADGFSHGWTRMDTDKNPKSEIRSTKQISMARTLQTQILEPRNALRTRKLFDGKNADGFNHGWTRMEKLEIRNSKSEARNKSQ